MWPVIGRRFIGLRIEWRHATPEDAPLEKVGRGFDVVIPNRRSTERNPPDLCDIAPDAGDSSPSSAALRRFGMTKKQYVTNLRRRGPHRRARIKRVNRLNQPLA